LIYLFSFLWNVILVLIFDIVIFYMRRLAIEMHFTRMHKFFIDQHPGNNCVLFIELFTNRHVSAIKKNNQSVFLFQLLQFDLWDLRNNYLFYNLLQFLTFVLWTIGRDIFFCWRLHKYVRVITIVVVLDQSTVTFQKGWGRGLLQFVWY
jgi:hypothetical protein